MGTPSVAGSSLWLCVAAGILALPASALPSPGEGAVMAQASEERDAQRDFDWGPGLWKTELRRLLRPLSGSDEWAEYTGTTLTREVWGGRASLVELDASGPAGRIQALALRLYNPATRQWSLNVSNSGRGTMAPPLLGGFQDGRGVFESRMDFDGRPIRVRFTISEITADSARYEQAFSEDDGETWEVNWIAVDTRIR